jgi:hypothetical protein
VAEWPTHVAKNSPICPHGAVVAIKRKIVDGKEGKRGGRWPASHKSLVGGHTWPPLNTHFHSSPYLVPLMLTPLTQIPFIFSKVLFISLIFLDFMRCNDAINKYAVEKE